MDPRPGEANVDASLDRRFVIESRVNQRFGKCKGLFV
jgi:hypothetical protein